jgi:hypothetical protein
MPGKRITQQQEQLYMSLRTKGLSQKLSSAKSGISERSGRHIEKGQHVGRKHDWRTRKDPLIEVWERELVPLLEKEPSLSAITLLEYLQSKYEGKYPDSIHRTLQRRIKHYKALSGPNKEVIFRQVHYPGVQGISDFTELKDIVVSIQGKPYVHLLYHFRLSFSGWSHVKVIEGGESYSGLSEGLQEALWRLGGSPKEHRTDSLSAAFKNLTKDEKEDITQRYAALCKHYQMTASRNNKGVSHENGSIESPHGHVKRRIKQALLLRGNSDFISVEAYCAFIDKVVNQHNQRNAKQVDMERSFLQALPRIRTIDFTETCARVTSSSTITIGRCTYSVPSRLIGECLRVHLYHNRLECFLGAAAVITLPRIRSKDKRVRRIDYRHLIESLVRKPQAFRFSILRDDLLPSDEYKAIWQYVENHLKTKAACQFIVGVLHLAASQNCEKALGEFILKQINQDKLPTLSSLQNQFGHTKPIPAVLVKQHPLASYDFFNDSHKEVTYGIC